MSAGWKSYEAAPVEGTGICKVEKIPDPGTLTLELDGFPLLLVRQNGAVKAFVNACPHQYLPLDYKGERLISADGKLLRCTNHQAGFLIETGEGVEGLGIGCKLDAVPVSITSDGRVTIG